MQRARTKSDESRIIEELSRLDDDEDPRETIAKVSARIVAYQAKGLEVPAELIRLNKALADQCVALSQGR